MKRVEPENYVSQLSSPITKQASMAHVLMLSFCYHNCSDSDSYTGTKSIKPASAESNSHLSHVEFTKAINSLTQQLKIALRSPRPVYLASIVRLQLELSNHKGSTGWSTVRQCTCVVFYYPMSLRHLGQSANKKCCKYIPSQPPARCAYLRAAKSGSSLGQLPFRSVSLSSDVREPSRERETLSGEPSGPFSSLQHSLNSLDNVIVGSKALIPASLSGDIHSYIQLGSLVTPQTLTSFPYCQYSCQEDWQAALFK